MQVTLQAVIMMTAECYSLNRLDGDWDRRVQLIEAVLRELLQVVDWVSHFNKFGNPIRHYVGMGEVRIALKAGTGYGWRIAGQLRSLGFESPALVAADWTPEEKQEWQPWNELLHGFLDHSAADMDLAGGVLLRATQLTCMRQTRQGRAYCMLSIWVAMAPLEMLGHLS